MHLWSSSSPIVSDTKNKNTKNNANNSRSSCNRSPHRRPRTHRRLLSQSGRRYATGDHRSSVSVFAHRQRPNGGQCTKKCFNHKSLPKPSLAEHRRFRRRCKCIERTSPLTACSRRRTSPSSSSPLSKSYSFPATASQRSTHFVAAAAASRKSGRSSSGHNG